MLGTYEDGEREADGRRVLVEILEEPVIPARHGRSRRWEELCKLKVGEYILHE